MLDCLADTFGQRAAYEQPNTAPVSFSSYAASLTDQDDMLEAALEYELTIIEKEQEQRAAIKLEKQNLLLPLRLKKIRRRIADLSDPVAPDFGRHYARAAEKIQCRTALDPKMNGPSDIAEYLSYSYTRQNRGFANRIDLNPDGLKDIDTLALSVFHEEGHAMQTAACAAAKLNPRNPDTRRIMHPLEWIRFIDLCERDVYARQGLVAFMLNKSNPTLREKTKYSLVSVDDFENTLAAHPRLQDALTQCALSALCKTTEVGRNSWTFADHYAGAAIGMYEVGMAERTREGETGHVYVRLRDEDFFAVGDYGAGPNALGEDSIDRRFMQPLELAQSHGQRVENLCLKYNIPPLDMCPYNNEYQQDAMLSARANMSLQKQNMEPCPAFA